MNKASSLASPSRLAITYRAVCDLIPDPRNARTHPKRQIDQIRASIEAFGFTNPILADPEGHILAGHARLNAGWDLEILQLERGQLASIDFDIDPTLTGFSTGEIDVILSSATDPDDEVIPPVPVTPRTSMGDVWILGDHQVVWRRPGCPISAAGHRRWSARVDAAFLDPPYNVPIGGHAVSAG